MKSKIIITFFLILTVLTVVTGMLIPSSENAKQNAQVGNSNRITVTSDGWALPTRYHICKPNQYCV